jgi:hypothetical protein
MFTLVEIEEVNREEARLRGKAADVARARRAARFEAAVQEAERKRQAALNTCMTVDDRAVCAYVCVSKCVHVCASCVHVCMCVHA